MHPPIFLELKPRKKYTRASRYKYTGGNVSKIGLNVNLKVRKLSFVLPGAMYDYAIILINSALTNGGLRELLRVCLRNFREVLMGVCLDSSGRNKRIF